MGRSPRVEWSKIDGISGSSAKSMTRRSSDENERQADPPAEPRHAQLRLRTALGGAAHDGASTPIVIETALSLVVLIRPGPYANIADRSV